MNVILIEGDELDVGASDAAHVVLAGRRFEHIRDVHRAAVGDRLRVGVLNGKMGEAEVTSLGSDQVELSLDLAALDLSPPAPSPVVLCVALSRPPTMAKVIGQATAMGVKHFVFFHARRVEKSYWQSSTLEPEAIRRQLLLGLEQARDTIMPRVEHVRRFLPFVEDRLPELAAGHGPIVVAHPGRGQAARTEGAIVLVVGPEGGFIDHELERFEASGAQFVDLGSRILRVETATVALLALASAS